MKKILGILNYRTQKFSLGSIIYRIFFYTYISIIIFLILIEFFFNIYQITKVFLLFFFFVYSCIFVFVDFKSNILQKNYMNTTRLMILFTIFIPFFFFLIFYKVTLSNFLYLTSESEIAKNFISFWDSDKFLINNIFSNIDLVDNTKNVFPILDFLNKRTKGDIYNLCKIYIVMNNFLQNFIFLDDPYLIGASLSDDKDDIMISFFNELVQVVISGYLDEDQFIDFYKSLVQCIESASGLENTLQIGRSNELLFNFFKELNQSIVVNYVTSEKSLLDLGFDFEKFIIKSYFGDETLMDFLNQLMNEEEFIQKSSEKAMKNYILSVCTDWYKMKHRGGDYYVMIEATKHEHV